MLLLRFDKRGFEEDRLRPDPGAILLKWPNPEFMSRVTPGEGVDEVLDEVEDLEPFARFKFNSLLPTSVIVSSVFSEYFRSTSLLNDMRSDIFHSPVEYRKKKRKKKTKKTVEHLFFNFRQPGNNLLLKIELNLLFILSMNFIFHFS